MRGRISLSACVWVQVAVVLQATAYTQPESAAECVTLVSSRAGASQEAVYGLLRVEPIASSVEIRQDEDILRDLPEYYPEALGCASPEIVVATAGANWSMARIEVEQVGPTFSLGDPVPIPSFRARPLDEVERGGYRWSPTQLIRRMSPDGTKYYEVSSILIEVEPSEVGLLIPAGHSLTVHSATSDESWLAMDGARERSILWGEPAWSPDSRCLAFQTARAHSFLVNGGWPPPQFGDLRAFDLRVWDATTGQTTVVAERGFKEDYSQPGHRGLYRWDPTSERVFFLHNDRDPAVDAGARLRPWLADLRGGHVGPISGSVEAVDDAIWSPSGNSVIVVARIGGERCFAELRVDGSEIRCLWRTPEFERHGELPGIADLWAISPDGVWLALWRGRTLHMCDLRPNGQSGPQRVVELPRGRRPFQMAWWVFEEPGEAPAETQPVEAQRAAP